MKEITVKKYFVTLEDIAKFVRIEEGFEIKKLAITAKNRMQELIVIAEKDVEK